MCSDMQPLVDLTQCAGDVPKYDDDDDDDDDDDVYIHRW